MSRVLLLLPTKTYRAEALLTAANALGVDVTVASEEVSSLAGANPGGLLALPFDDPAAAALTAADFARRYPIHAVIPVDEETAVLAAAISAALGLPYNSIESAEATRNKFIMRERMARGGVRIPSYRLFSPLEWQPDNPAGSESALVLAEILPQVTYPCVLKPLILSASRGVIRANDPGEFTRAFQRIGAILRAPEIARRGPAARQILVEDYIPGREVALEGLLTEGRLDVLALFDKPDPLDGPFFEETIYVTPSRLPADVQADIIGQTVRATWALDLRTGPIHAELRVNAQGAWVIEVAARSIGGRCARVLHFGAGVSLEELVLRHALRRPIASMARERQAAGVMMIPTPQAGVLNEVRGLETARALPGIEEVSITVPLGRSLAPLPEGSAYLGFIFARGETPEFVETVLRTAHSRLVFDIIPQS